MAKMIRVLSPVGESAVEVLRVPPLPSLEGKTVGFIDNRKTNFDHLVGLLGTTLKMKFGVGEVIHRQKAHAAIGATPEILADLVITGSGD